MTHDEKKREGNQEGKTSIQVVEDGSAVRKEDTLERPVTVQPVTKPKKSKKKEWVMPVLLTIFTAAIIGTVSGLFMLELFVGLDEEEVARSEEQESERTVTANQNEPARTRLEIEPLSSFVLQAGVFTERENAEEWLALYDGLGEQSIIWERDNQYFLFIGIYGTEEEARSKVEELQANDIDVFMKEWQTMKETNPELLESELDWLNQFQATWQEALVAKDHQSLIDLAKDAPDSSTLGELVERLEYPREALDTFFLELMKAYETF